MRSRLLLLSSAGMLGVALLSGCSASVNVGETSAEPTVEASTDSSQAPAPELSETVTNDEYGFSFKYAPPFEPQDDTTFAGEGGEDSTTTEAVFDTEGAQIDGQYRDAFVVNVYPLQVEITQDNLPDARAELENSVVPQLKSSTPGMQISELRDTELAGFPGFAADASFDVSGQPIKSTMYFVFAGSTEYQVLVQAAEKNWDALQPTFDAMLQSFTVTAATSTASPSGA